MLARNRPRPKPPSRRKSKPCWPESVCLIQTKLSRVGPPRPTVAPRSKRFSRICSPPASHREGLLGMSWSWFVAGVPSLVVSQWNVDDASTAKLIGEFYTRLIGGATKAEALRHAQIMLLKTKATRHPFFWAPFILVGDAR
ncbi:MAG: hypothetical protein C0467_20385 [Planctomycetaceae bacterium]|nr:hypothetical protein [Planctomycetaceae bacterium]